MTRTREDPEQLELTALAWRVSLVAATLTVVMGSLVLLGHALDVAVLRRLWPSGPDAHVHAALAITILGLVLLLLLPGVRVLRSAGQVLAAGVFVFHVFVLAGYVIGLGLGVDLRIAGRTLAVAGGAPPLGMSFFGALDLAILSLAIVVLDAAPRRRVTPSEALSVLALVPAFLVLTAHASGATLLAGTPVTGAPTAVALASAAIAILSLRPDQGVTAIIYGPGVAGVIARRVLPTAVLVTLFVTWLSELAEGAGYETEALSATGAVLLFTLIIGGGLLRLHDAERERRRTQARLARSETFLREVMERVGSGIVVKDADLRYVLVNRRAARVLRATPEDLIGRRLSEVNPGPEAASFEGDDRRVLRERRGHTAERAWTADGITRIYLTTKTPFFDDAGEPAGVVSVFQDITDRKRTELELQRTNKDLVRVAAIAAHDLREPVRKVGAFASLLESRHRDALGPEGRRTLRRLRDAAQRLDVLVTDLLLYTSVRPGDQHFRAVDLSRLVARVLDELDDEVRATGAQVEVDDLPVVEANVPQLQRLVHNLLDNAIKYRRRDVPPHVRISASVEGGLVQLRFEDNGIGVDPRHAERIFEPFKRLHGAAEYEGTGMGLALVRRIAECHQGSVRVEGRPGVGSAFVVTIPQHHVRVEEAVAP